MKGLIIGILASSLIAGGIPVMAQPTVPAEGTTITSAAATTTAAAKKHHGTHHKGKKAPKAASTHTG